MYLECIKLYVARKFLKLGVEVKGLLRPGDSRHKFSALHAPGLSIDKKSFDIHSNPVYFWCGLAVQTSNTRGKRPVQARIGRESGVMSAKALRVCMATTLLGQV
jgi:hypothetical protein